MFISRPFRFIILLLLKYILVVILDVGLLHFKPLLSYWHFYLMKGLAYIFQHCQLIRSKGIKMPMLRHKLTTRSLRRFPTPLRRMLSRLKPMGHLKYGTSASRGVIIGEAWRVGAVYYLRMTRWWLYVVLREGFFGFYCWLFHFDDGLPSLSSNAMYCGLLQVIRHYGFQ